MINHSAKKLWNSCWGNILQLKEVSILAKGPGKSVGKHTYEAKEKVTNNKTVVNPNLIPSSPAYLKAVPNLLAEGKGLLHYFLKGKKLLGISLSRW